MPTPATPAHAYLTAKLTATTAILEHVVRAITSPQDPAAQESLERAAGAERLAASLRDSTRVPIISLASRLGLSLHEEHVVWLLLAHELVPEARGLIRVVAGGTAPDPTVDAIRRIVYGTAPSTAWRDLSPEGPLARLMLVERTDGSGPEVPEYRRTLRIARRVIALAHGAAGVDAEIAGISRLLGSGDVTPPTLEYAGDPRAAVGRQLDASRGGLVVIAGRVGSGRRSLVTSVVASRGRPTLEVDAQRLPETRDQLVSDLRRLARESRLLGATLVLTNLDALTGEHPDRVDRIAILDRELVAAVDEPVFATATRPVPGRWSGPPVTIELAPLSGRQLAVLWSAALPGLHPSDADHLAQAYPFTAALIQRVGAAAVAGAAGPDVTQSDIRAAIRAVLDDRLGALATRVTTTQQWDDLVLPPGELEPIAELIARVRERRRVYEDWGFARKLGKGLGVSALFSGPPGTGKTMVAGLIAAELELELYQVDLAKVVSKWIGETEKNLAALFDAAEAGHAVLLFDEADALFARRTEVRSSNDRNANLEVNYLLQRLETFTGICILTTNNDSGLDDAFRRRLALHVRFVVPDEATRSLLWRSMIPANAPVVDGVDYDALARRYPMTGGHIRNAALRAAFIAADEQSAITSDHLMRGGRMELEGMGRVTA